MVKGGESRKLYWRDVPSIPRVSSLLLAIVVVAGCGPKIQRLTMEPLLIRVDRVAGETTVNTPDPLLEEIGGLQDAGRCEEAIPRLERFLEDFPESLRFGEAVVRLGMCHEEREEWERARGYHRWAAENAHFDLAFEAALRGAWCLEHMGEPELAAREYEALAGVARGPDEARAGARMRQAINLFRAGKTRKAHAALERGTRAYSAVPDPGPAVRSAAAEARFAAAEEEARAFSAIRLEYPQRKLEKRVRAKLQALLAARTAFQRVVQIKDAEWAAAAVCREAELLEELHRALVEVPPPASFDAEERARYLAGVSAKSKPLLQQAFDNYVQVAALGERVGLESPWVTKARERVRELETQLKTSVVSPDEPHDVPHDVPPDDEPHETPDDGRTPTP